MRKPGERKSSTPLEITEGGGLAAMVLTVVGGGKREEWGVILALTSCPRSLPAKKRSPCPEKRKGK